MQTEEIKLLEDSKFIEAFVELIRRVSSDLPSDVVKALEKGYTKEEDKSKAKNALGTILENQIMAREGSRPICQDTGTVLLDIYYPFGMRESRLVTIIKQAIVKATGLNYLRPNVVDSITGKSKSDNIGRGHPSIHFHQHNSDHFKVLAVLKGGGCENVGVQYSLPYTPLNAGRDINGIKKVIIDAILKAQGKGCSPGILGIGIGGDRASSYIKSKEVLHKKLDEKNEDPLLAELEEWVLREANKLQIGPMGFGGNTTLIGAKAGIVDRIPASYFVAVTYMCWAYRRKAMTIKNSGDVSYD